MEIVSFLSLANVQKIKRYASSVASEQQKQKHNIEWA